MVEVSSGVSAERRLAWMALVLTPGMGPTRCARAVQRLGGDAERLFAASLTELEGLGLPAEAAQFVFDGRARKAAIEEVSRVTDAGATFLTMDDAEYPAQADGDLRSAAGAVGAGRCVDFEPGRDCGGGDAESDAVWRGDGGDAEPGPGEAREW